MLSLTVLILLQLHHVGKISLFGIPCSLVIYRTIPSTWAFVFAHVSPGDRCQLQATRGLHDQ